jgi:murein DD-endopeptidase MepM/ murein hydrolase activator NlpD
MQNPSIGQDCWRFVCCLGRYIRYRGLQFFHFFEGVKSWLVEGLYHQRGRYVRPFVHSGMAFLVVGGIIFGPTLVAENFSNPWAEETTAPAETVLSASTVAEMETATLISAKPRAEVIEYEVKEGDTVSTIAEMFGISVDTIRWENDLESIKTIKPGQILRILPITGMRHTVKHGETIYSIAKRYQVDAQVIVNWPYNSFANDETFALAAGQTLMVPEGIKPKETPTAPRRYWAQVPVAGTVTGTGQFVWPVGGNISQNFTWYHKAIDIANKAAPDVVAADSGQVIIVGWPSPWAYGNRVLIDHGNGYATLYAHLSGYYVSAGQKVSRGQAIGKMGSTGRSSGVHLHFEIRQNGVAQNPLNFLK